MRGSYRTAVSGRGGGRGAGRGTGRGEGTGAGRGAQRVRNYRNACSLIPSIKVKMATFFFTLQIKGHSGEPLTLASLTHVTQLCFCPSPGTAL